MSNQVVTDATSDPTLVINPLTQDSGLNPSFGDPSDCEDKTANGYRYASDIVDADADDIDDVARTAAIVMVADALHRTTSLYYVEEDEHGHKIARTIWDKTAWGNFLALWMRSAFAHKIESRISTLSILLLFVERLDNDTCYSSGQIVIEVVEGLFLVYFWTVWVLKLSCTWRSASRWFKANEGVFMILLGVALITSTIGWIGSLFVSDCYPIQTVNGTIWINEWDYPAWFMRAYFFVYFNPGLRHAARVVINVIRTLGPITAMVACSFLLHFFLISAFVEEGSAEQQAVGFGQEDFDATLDSLFYLYVCLTTANHPDVFMPLYNDKPWTFLCVISFMTFTAIILLNLLLAVVASEFTDIQDGYNSERFDRRLCMLSTAFRKLADLGEPGDEQLLIQAALEYEATAPNNTQAVNVEFRQKLRHRMEELHRQEVAEGRGCRKYFMSVERLREVLEVVAHHDKTERHTTRTQKTKESLAAVGGKHFLVDTDWKDLLIHLMDRDGSATIGLAEFQRLSAVFQSPIRIRRTSDQSTRFAARKQALQREKMALDCIEELESIKSSIEHLQNAPNNIRSNPHCVEYLQELEDRQLQVIKKARQSRSSDDVQDRLKEIQQELEDMEDMGEEMWGARFRTIYHWVTETQWPSELNWYSFGGFFSISFGHVTSVLLLIAIVMALAKISSTDPLFIIMTVLLTIEIVLRFLAEWRTWSWYNYFLNPLNWVDLFGNITMWISIFTRGDSDALVSMYGIARSMRVARFLKSVPSLRILAQCIKRVIPAVVPHMGLFLAVFYVYAVWGMAMFAGMQTKEVIHGGPGKWQISPWNSTTYGQNEFYYQLNFDRAYNGFVTLFMLMIQNNWHVTVDGFVQTNGWTNRQGVRLWFISFNVLVAILMINVLVGVLIDTLDLYRRDATQRYNQEFWELQQKIQARSDRRSLDESRQLTRDKIPSLFRCCSSGYEEQLMDNKVGEIKMTGNSTVLKEIDDFMVKELSRKNTRSGYPWSDSWEIFDLPVEMEQLIVDYKGMEKVDQENAELESQHLVKTASTWPLSRPMLAAAPDGTLIRSMTTGNGTHGVDDVAEPQDASKVELEEKEDPPLEEKEEPGEENRNLHVWRDEDTHADWRGQERASAVVLTV